MDLVVTSLEADESLFAFCFPSIWKEDKASTLLVGDGDETAGDFMPLSAATDVERTVKKRDSG